MEDSQQGTLVMETGGSSLPVRVLDRGRSGCESSQTVPQEDHAGDSHALPATPLLRSQTGPSAPLWDPLGTLWPRAAPEA